MDSFLSVIICTYNREKYLRESLEYIAQQTLENRFFELIVVNNNSTDSTKDICKTFESDYRDINYKYIFEKNPGLSWARNRGIREASGDMLIFLDDDALASENYLKEIHSYFSLNKNVIAGGGKIIPFYETMSPGWMTKYLLPVVSALDLGNSTRKFPKNKYPIGANMFFRKAFFQEYGYFRTDLGRKGRLLLGGEEKDVFQRIHNPAQEIIYLPGAMVRHIVPQERIENGFIDDMAKGVGISEVIRYRKNNQSLWKLYWTELYKWTGSIVLFLLFLLKFEMAKGKKLIRFRYFVCRGMQIGKKYDTQNTEILQ